MGLFTPMAPGHRPILGRRQGTANDSKRTVGCAALAALGLHWGRLKRRPPGARCQGCPALTPPTSGARRKAVEGTGFKFPIVSIETFDWPPHDGSPIVRPQ